MPKVVDSTDGPDPADRLAMLEAVIARLEVIAPDALHRADAEVRNQLLEQHAIRLEQTNADLEQQLARALDAAAADSVATQGSKRAKTQGK